MRIRQDLGPSNIVIKNKPIIEDKEVVLDEDILIVVQDVMVETSISQAVIEEVIIQDTIVKTDEIEHFIVEEEIIQLKDAGPVFKGPQGPDLYQTWLNQGNQGSFNDFLAVVRQGLNLGGATTNNSFKYVQNMPSAVWLINHNMNKKPSVVCVDSAGETFDADYMYLDNNNLKITIIAPTAGEAYLN